MDMGIKNALFDDCLIGDGWLIGLGGIFILMCMWLYTNSFFITIMTVVANIFSLGIAYFVYTFLFELTFFPFMNLLAIIVLIGKHVQCIHYETPSLMKHWLFILCAQVLVLTMCSYSSKYGIVQKLNELN